LFIYEHKYTVRLRLRLRLWAYGLRIIYRHSENVKFDQTILDNLIVAKITKSNFKVSFYMRIVLAFLTSVATRFVADPIIITTIFRLRLYGKWLIETTCCVRNLCVCLLFFFECG